MSTVISILCGALSSPFGQPATARVRGRTDAASVRLAVSRDPGMMWATYLPAQAPTAQGVFDFTITGLAPNMERYYYAVECDGDLDLTKVGTFLTFPEEGTQRNHRTIVGSCLGQAGDNRWRINNTSNTPLLEIIGREDPALTLLTMFIGDHGYFDNDSADIALSRANIAENLLRPRQQALFLRRPMNDLWDDHDYGADNSDKTSPSRAPKNQAYRETMPHYPLPSTTGYGIWHSFPTGDVRHLMTDLRTDRDPNSDADTSDKRMMSAEQETWFENMLIDAATNPLVGKVRWYSTTPWLGELGGGVTAATLSDHWALFSYQRDRIATMIETFKARSGKGFTMVSGDIHALRYDDGSNNKWGGFPVFGCGAIDASPNVRGGAWFSGGWSTGSARYLRVDDSYYPDGSVTTMQGRIWDTPWKSLAIGSPDGFRPAVVA